MSETTPDPVLSSAPKESGGVGAAPSPEAVEAFLMAPKVQAPHDAARDWASLSGRWGHQHSTPLPEGLAGIGARGQEPVAPGSALAEVQEQLPVCMGNIREVNRLMQAAGMGTALSMPERVRLLIAERDYERRRANEAIAQLHDAQRDLKAITAALDADPERSPAWDDNDRPIPLPRRVEVALMPEGPGKTWIERKIMGHLDSYGVPTERNGITLTLASRVAVAAEGWRDHSPDAGKKVNG